MESKIRQIEPQTTVRYMNQLREIKAAWIVFFLSTRTNKIFEIGEETNGKEMCQIQIHLAQTLLTPVFWSPTTPEMNIWLVRRQQLHGDD